MGISLSRSPAIDLCLLFNDAGNDVKLAGVSKVGVARKRIETLGADRQPDSTALLSDRYHFTQAEAVYR